MITAELIILQILRLLRKDDGRMKKPMLESDIVCNRNFTKEELEMIETANRECDPLFNIAKSLQSIDRTLKHIEEQLKKRRV